MNERSAGQRPNRSRLVVGLLLLLLGALLLAGNLGYGLPEGWWQYFPILFIAFGLWGVVAPGRHMDRHGGVWLIAIGLYFLIGIFDLWGLGWTGAWPVFVIAAGLSFIVHRHPNEEERSRSPGNGAS